MYDMKRLPTILFLLMTVLCGFGQTSTKLSGTPIGSPNVDYSTNQSSTTVNTPADVFDGNYKTF